MIERLKIIEERYNFLTEEMMRKEVWRLQKNERTRKRKNITRKNCRNI